MADIINTDNGSVAAGKANERLGTGIGVGDNGSAWAAKVNTVGAGVVVTDSGSQFATKVNALSPMAQTLRVMTLNVGHYADGQAANPSFNASTYAAYAAKFNAFLDAIDADIIFVQEYSTNVYQNNAAKDVLFGKYNYYTIGTVSGYLGNALFSKYPHTFVRQTAFAQQNFAGRYYQLFEMVVRGNTIGMVNTHLDTTQKGNNYRFSQFGEIVDSLKGYDYAIFAGDCNVARVQDDGLGAGQWNLINYWVNGGVHDLGAVYGVKDFGSGYGGGDYTLANNAENSINTYPTTRCASTDYPALCCPCDGISVKGFTMSNITRVDSTDTPVNDITDHCAFYCDLTMIDEGGTT